MRCAHPEKGIEQSEPTPRWVHDGSVEGPAAYGSDHADRLELPPIAVQRAERFTERRIGLGPQVVVIGDTPRDVDCALAWGATAIGVATGRSSARQLLNAGAHVALEDLSDTEAVIKAVTGGRG